jgi:predicted acylesterase/phospholipase RssA/CRP-like cAMP-binding protein
MTFDAELARVAAALAQVPLLGAVDQDTLHELAARAERMDIAAGAILFRAGDPADSLYFVEHGRLDAIVVDDEQQTVARRFRHGDAFGELGLLGDGSRSATVLAVRDSRVWKFSSESFGWLLEHRRGFAAALARVLAARVRAGNRPAPELPTARVVAVIPGHPGAPVDALVESFAPRLDRYERVTIVRQLPGDEQTWVPAVERLEQEPGVLLLVASQFDSPAWQGFSAREADRTLAVVNRHRNLAPDRSATDVVSWGGPIGRSSGHTAASHLVRGAADRGGLDRLARRVAGCSIGLVLSGGGSRALAHLGVLRVLEERSIIIDRVAGTSMGALIGALVARDLDRGSLETALREELRRRPFRDYCVPRHSLIRAERARHMIERLLDTARIEELPKSFACVSVDLAAAERVVHRRGDLVVAVGASMSLPGMAPPRLVDGRVLVDGGVLDNIPVDVLAETGEGPTIAVDVTRRAFVSTGPNRDHRLPSITDTLGQSMTVGSHQRTEAQRLLARVVIEPDVQALGLFDFARIDAAIQAGELAARRSLDSMSAPIA